MAKSFSVFVNIGGNLNPSLGAAVKAAQAQISRLSGHVSAINTQVGKSLLGAGSRLQSAGRSMTTAVTFPMGLLATSAGRTVFEVEKAGNAVRAVTEMTREQRAEIEKLARSQRFFGPEESMKSALELAKTGFNADQIRGTLEGALKLARAGDVSAEAATDIVTNVLTSMRLPMETAAQAASSMKRVGDVFAYTANKTNTDVQLLGETFKFVSNLGATAGLDVESLAAAAGKMANEGIRGSEAGVALRAALIRMVRPTKPAIAALDRLGLSMSNFVTQSREIDSGAIIKSLQSSGINADGARAAIDKILADPTSKYDVSKTVTGITDAIVGVSGGNSMDRDLLAERITDALIGAADKVDFVGFLRALKEKGVSTGDLAAIFQTQHASRMGSLLQGSLVEAIDDVRKNAPGYFDRAFEMRMEGLVGSVYRLDSAWKNLFVTLGKTGIIDAAASVFERVSDGLTKIGEANPALLKFGTYAGLAAIALGPLMWAAGGALRAIGGFVTFLGSGAGRLLAFGRAAGLAAGWVGLIVGTLVALGVWIYNNWTGIVEMLGGFGDAIAQRFPKAAEAIGWIGDKLGVVWDWLGKILGPLDASPEKWRMWGWTAGQAVADVIDAVIGLPGKIASAAVAFGNAMADLAQRGWNAVVNFDWAGLGRTIVQAIIDGVSSMGAALANKLSSMASDAWGGVKSKLGFGGAPTASAGAPGAPAVAGARARGGPVRAGLPYLVGERGPEIFVPSMSGRIETNDTLDRLSSPASVASVSGDSGSRGDRSVIYAPTFHIDGAQDPGAIRREIEEYMRRLERQQTALLSD